MSDANHDHATCIEHALARAEAVCAERGTRLTTLRRQVLELVWAGHRPRGAYQILDDLKVVEGKGVAPLTVYRALEFLEEQGLVHRIESLNAYVGCAASGGAHRSQFLVCTVCGSAVEFDDPALNAAIDAVAQSHGFRPETPVVEVRGLCEHCRLERESR